MPKEEGRKRKKSEPIAVVRDHFLETTPGAKEKGAQRWERTIQNFGASLEKGALAGIATPRGDRRSDDGLVLRTSWGRAAVNPKVS